MIELKILDLNDAELLKGIIEDDGMIFELNEVEKFINADNTYGFIAKENNKLIGLAYAYSLPQLDGNKLLYIHSIDILKQYQNKGYGTQLMKFILEYSKDNGFQECFLASSKDLRNACHIYEKLGGKSHYENEIIYVFDIK